jgi:glycosyltransferase involved in cell wall biosynthesis
MKKIAFVITGLTYGGAETQLLNMSVALSKKNIQCLVISMIPIEGGLAPRFLNSGIELVSLDMQRGKVKLSSMFKYRRIIKNFDPDVIHSHMIHANIFTRLANLRLGIPLFNTAHNVYEGGKLLEMLYRFTYPLCDYMTQVSDEGLQRYLANGLAKADNACVMKNAIQAKGNVVVSKIKTQLALNDTEFLFITVGRLETVKNHELLIKAFSQVESAHCLIVGVGPLELQLKKFATQQGVGDRIHFLGKRDDIYNLMQAADAFILSSNYEGLPITILEALESRLPVISTNVGAISESIDHKNGLLVPAKNLLQLVLAIKTLIVMDSNMLSEMGSESYAKAKAYHAENVCLDWLNLYKTKL